MSCSADVQGERLQGSERNAKVRGMFDQSIADKVCEGLTNGLSERQACKQAGTTRSRLRRWLDGDEFPELRDQYARAMAARARWHAQRIEEIAVKVERDEIKPDAARVAIDARKWIAARMLPKVYGDRVQVYQDTRLRIEVFDPRLEQRQAQRAALQGAPSAAALVQDAAQSAPVVACLTQESGEDP